MLKILWDMDLVTLSKFLIHSSEINLKSYRFVLSIMHVFCIRDLKKQNVMQTYS